MIMIMIMIILAEFCTYVCVRSLSPSLPLSVSVCGAKRIIETEMGTKTAHRDRQTKRRQRWRQIPHTETETDALKLLMCMFLISEPSYCHRRRLVCIWEAWYRENCNSWENLEKFTHHTQRGIVNLNKGMARD